MNHADHVLASLESNQFAGTSSLASSWRRSFELHQINPFERPRLQIANQSAIRERKQKAARLIAAATGQLDHLFSLVGASGCTVILADGDGFILEQRNKEGNKDDFQDWGLCQGANWSEQTEGTNGIGTCLAESRPVIIRQDQHFLPKNIAMTCIGMPIYGVTGRLIGVLDVSSARQDQSEVMQTLIAASIKNAVRQVEAQNFKSYFAKERVVLVDQNDLDQSALVAINSDDCIVGATRAARAIFDWGFGNTLEPIAATDIFKDNQKVSGFGRGEKAAIVKAITRANGNISAAAQGLGIGRATLYRRMKRLGLSRSESRLGLE